MKSTNSLIVIAIKRLLFFSLPIIGILYIIYEIILGYDMSFSWQNVILYGVMIGIATISNYIHKSREEKIEDKDWLRKVEEQNRWKITEKNENELTLRPRFDFPYNLLSKEKVRVKYSEDVVTIDGPRYYIDQLVKDMNGRSNKWMRGFASAGAFLIAFVILSIPVIFESGVYWDLRIQYHNYQMRNVQKIEVQDVDALGNTVDNINNYGDGVETDNYIFYVENHMNLVKADKNLDNKEYLIQRDGGNGIGSLNVVDDWIFYTSGESLNRMRIDGAQNNEIYRMSYLLDTHLMGQWIYFINFQDNSNVYRIDVNGQNLERFLQIEVLDLAVYDGRLFYSYLDEGSGYVKSVDLDGGDRRLEFQTDSGVRSLTKYNDNYYYINSDYRLIRAEIGAPELYQVAIDQNVSSYIVTDEGIFYSLHGEEVGYPGEGLYRMDHFGLDKTLISDARFVEGFSKVGHWVLYHSSDNDMHPNLKRIDLNTGEIDSME
ncbi:MAG: DUF5050 domain-containing protein [Bacillota bacterium]